MLLNFTVDGTVGARGRIQRCRGSLSWSGHALVHALTTEPGNPDAHWREILRGHACATTTDSPFMLETWSLSM